MFCPFPPPPPPLSSSILSSDIFFPPSLFKHFSNSFLRILVQPSIHTEVPTYLPTHSAFVLSPLFAPGKIFLEKAHGTTEGVRKKRAAASFLGEIKLDIFLWKTHQICKEVLKLSEYYTFVGRYTATQIENL